MFTRQPDIYFYIVNKVVKQDLNMTKILHLYHKLWFSNPYIFGTQCREILIFQTFIIWSNTSHCLKCQRSTALEFKDIEIIKSEFVAKTQFLCLKVSDRGPKGLYWLWISNVNQNQKNPQNSFRHLIVISHLIAFTGSKTVWNHSENVLAVMNEADYTPNITTKIWLTSNELRKIQYKKVNLKKYRTENSKSFSKNV